MIGVGATIFGRRPLLARSWSSALTIPIGCSYQKRTIMVVDRNDRLCEGFRALAYESLQCRNPRAPLAGLWV